MSTIPALAIRQANDATPGTVPRIPAGNKVLASAADGGSAAWVDPATIGGIVGANAFSLTTGPFTQPAVGATVNVSTITAWMAPGQPAFVEGGGSYTIVGLVSGSVVTLRNTGTTGNAAPGVVIGTGAKVSPSGIAGTGSAVPAPDYVAISNITLSGSQAVDGATPATGKVVLCVGQTNPAENGPQIANTSGAWARPSYFDSDAEVAALNGLGTGLVLGGVTYAGSQWYLQSGITLAGAKVYRRVIPGVTLYMPPPNGANDLPAFTALVSELTGVGGTIQFQSGTYKSPIGFQLTNLEGIHVRGVSSTVSGVSSTLFQYTGPRVANSTCFRIFGGNSCSIEGVGFLSSVSGPEFGCLIGGNGVTDADYCHVFDCQAYGNAAAAPLTTSATSINVDTATGASIAITLAAATVPYTVGTELLLCSRLGSGILKGDITASSGTSVTFVPVDAFGSGVHTDWDVLQPMNGFNVGSSELCTICRSTATLCYDSFRMGGVGGVVDASCTTSSPLGPSFRTGSASSYVKLFGTAEAGTSYPWTIAVHVDDAVNFECSVSMGDGYAVGLPYVFRNIRGGTVHGLNSSCVTAGTAVMSVDTCSGLHISGVYGDSPSGFFVKNLGSNSNCTIEALHAHVGTMNTFVGGTFAGFTTWYDVATNQLNFDTAKAQTLEAKNGFLITPGAMSLANGRNDNISLPAALCVIAGPTGAFQISGFAPPSDGHVLSFLYLGAQTLTLLHANTNSTAGNRLLCPGGQDLVLVPRSGGAVYFEIVYSATAGAWIVNAPASAQTTPIRVANGTTDAPTFADIGANIQYTNAAGCALTLNTMPAGTTMLVSQEAAGVLTFTSGTATLRTALAGSGATTAQYQSRFLFWKDATNVRIT